MNDIIAKTAAFVRQKLQNAEAGHDWFHIERVWKNALHIARHERCDLTTVQLAALLHDIADSKFHGGDESVGPRLAREFLESENVAEPRVSHVVAIIENVGFKGGTLQYAFQSKELDIVQDADRLDALGAIGIARAFHYGGFKNRTLYDPSVAPKPGMTREAYKHSAAPTLNHFYEKLLLLKDRMNTETGRALATKRHEFMEAYLAQFLAEWGEHA
jgi:uncharacterized protein